MLVASLLILAPAVAAAAASVPQQDWWRSAGAGNVRSRTSFRVLWGAGQNVPMRTHVVSEVAWSPPLCRRVSNGHATHDRQQAPLAPPPRAAPLQVDRDRHRAMCTGSVAMDANYEEGSGYLDYYPSSPGQPSIAWGTGPFRPIVINLRPEAGSTITIGFAQSATGFCDEAAEAIFEVKVRGREL